MSNLLEKLKQPKKLSPLMMRLKGQTPPPFTPQAEEVGPDAQYEKFKEQILKDEDLMYTLMTAVADEVGKLEQGKPGEPGADGVTPTDEDIKRVAEQVIKPLVPQIAQKAATMIRPPKDGDPGKSIKGDRGPAPIPGKHYYTKSQVEDLIAEAVKKNTPVLGAIEKSEKVDLSGLASTEELEALKDEIKKLRLRKGGGSSGGGGGGSWIRETPVGTINGSNVTFTITNNVVSGSETLYLGGIGLTPTTDYSISGRTITYVVAPDTGNTHSIKYIRG